MRSVARIIARIMRSMPKFIMERIKVAGEWVARMVAVGGEPAAPVSDDVEEFVEASTPRADNDDSEDVWQIKKLAAVLVGRVPPTAEQMRGVSELQYKWLKAQDTHGLCVIACADPMMIRAHLRNTVPIKGLVPFHPQAIRDVATARTKPAPSPKRKTLRLLLEEQGIHP